MDKTTRKKRIRSFLRTFAVVFLILIFGLAITSLVLPDKTFSTSEKRNLTTIHDIDSDILDGNLSSDFENYASDQIAGRDLFIQFSTTWKLLLGNRESQGVYYGKDGVLIEKMDSLNKENLSQTIQAINSFSEKAGIPATLVLIPNAVSICQDKLPKHALTADQDAVYNFIRKRLSDQTTLLNPSDTLRDLYANGEQVYYSSDHHWTSRAAYACLPAICDALDITAKTFSPLLVCDTFVGSLAAKSGFTPKNSDKIYIYKPEGEENYIVTNTDEKTKTASIYSLEGLSSSDPYTVFLGGNASHLNIKTDHPEKKRLLVFKDSYFNSFLPFLVDEFAEIDIIDPRYYYGDISALLSETDYDEILYFYNMNTFASDTSLVQVIGGNNE